MRWGQGQGRTWLIAGGGPVALLLGSGLLASCLLKCCYVFLGYEVGTGFAESFFVGVWKVPTSDPSLDACWVNLQPFSHL